jgi:O-antigen ligase
VLAVAMLGTLALGAFRLATNPEVVTKLVPVVFDTGSVALMAMTVFYIVGMWACGRYRPNQAVARMFLCLGLLLLIVLSYRRTMWGAIAVAALLVPFMLPARARGRLLLLGALGTFAGMIVLGTTPAGQALLQSVLSRAQETTLSQSSTLYRFAIVTWLFDHMGDIPLFGYGLTPLWNEIVRIRFFVTSLENVHSLYVWLLLRTGFIGFILCGVGLGLIVARIGRVFRTVRDDDQYRVIVGVVFLSIVLFLFNGIFNPVYANVRHLVPLGLSLALITNLPRIVAARRDAPAPAARGETLPAA